MEDVLMELVYASGGVRPQGGDVVLSAPIEGGLIQIDAPCHVLPAELRPGAGNKLRAAKVFAKKRGRPAIELFVDPVHEGHFGIGRLNGLLIKDELVGGAGCVCVVS